MSVRPGELGLGRVMTSLPLTCSFRCGPGSHSIQMANCLVPVSANHSDSLSLLKTRSLFKDLMVSKINLGSCVIPCPCALSPPPYTSLPQDGNFCSRKPTFTWQGIVERGGQHCSLPRVPEFLLSVQSGVEEPTWEGLVSTAHSSPTNLHALGHPEQVCPTLPEADLQEAPSCIVLFLKFPKVICVAHLGDKVSVICFRQS